MGLKIRIKRLESQYYPLRFPLFMRGKKYSAIIMDGCNFNCPFCFESDVDPDGKKRENMGILSLDKVIDFAINEVSRGNPIEITGGECTNQPEALSELIYAIKSKGGYINLATNGSRPEVVEKLSNKIDCLGLDIKSPPANIEFYSGASSILSYEKPLRLLQNSKEFGCDVHFKRIMFGNTSLKDLEFFYHFASHAFWILKQLRPFYSKYEPNNDFLSPISSERLHKIAREFVSLHAELTGRVVSISGGSGRDQKNYTYL